jgi:hypothetical protein
VAAEEKEEEDVESRMMKIITEKKKLLLNDGVKDWQEMTVVLTSIWHDSIACFSL